MKRVLLISLILSVCCSLGVSAQRANARPAAQQQRTAQQPSDKDRERWMEEMRQYKRDFLSRELSLSAEQRDRFFPLYEKMDQELMRIDGNVRQMERSLCKKANGVTDAEWQRCSQAAFSIEQEQGKVLSKYYPKFKAILTPQQLAKLRPAERKFQRELMEHRGAGNPGQPR